MNTSSVTASFTAISPSRSEPSPSWLVKAGAAVGAALRSAAAARARREMLAFAERCQALQPDLAAELRAASARLATD